MLTELWRHSYFSKNLFLKEILLKEQQLWTKANNSEQSETNVRKWKELCKGYAAPDCDTHDSNLVYMYMSLYHALSYKNSEFEEILLLLLLSWEFIMRFSYSSKRNKILTFNPLTSVTFLSFAKMRVITSFQTLN